MRLTPFGRALLPQARLVLNDCGRLADVVDAFNGMARGLVRDDIAAGRVNVLRTESEGVLLRSGLLYRADSPKSLAASALADLLRRNAQERGRDTALR